jgi:hypothetical protein
MAQTGYTPIRIYYSATTTNVPLAANLAAGELAINTADGKLFYKDSSNVVQVIATKGGVGSSSTTQILYNSSGLVVGSSSLTFNGTTFTAPLVNSVAIGLGAGSISSNLAVGSSVLGVNTTGNNNVAVGDNALALNTTGGANVAVGSGALYANITSEGHVAIGGSALNQFNGSGSSNIAIGLRTGKFTSGGQNIAMGQDAISTSGSSRNNIAIGGSTMAGSGNLGENNVALGIYALNRLTTGYNNNAIGYEALKNLTTGTGNTAIGPSLIGGTYAPVFDPTTQDNRFCMGSTSVTNAYIQVAWTVVSDARDKTDFAPVPHGLDFVTKLQPTAYRYKASREDTEGHGPVRYGFKAQDVLAEEGANPVIVDNEDPEKLRFNDQSMIAVLVNAIKELKAEFDAYKVAHP